MMEENQQEQLAAVFAEWVRQWREDPDAFATADEAISLPADKVGDYGHRMARTYLRIKDELSAATGTQ